MNIKRIILGVVLVGLIGGGIFTYIFYTNFFTPNTSFETEEAFVFIPTDASLIELETRLVPLVENFDSFKSAADKKGYLQG